MASTGLVDVTMISSAGYATAAGTPVFFNGYSIQTATTVDTVFFRDGSTGSMWIASPAPGKIQASGVSSFQFEKSNSPWFENGIYMSHASTRLVSVGFSLSQGLSS